MLLLRRRKGLALVAYLAATGQPHSREMLAALFWPGLCDARARGNLRRELSLLRSVLGADVLDTERGHVALNRAARLRVDVEQFRRLLTDARCTPPSTATDAARMAALAEAVRLYTDDFLSGFSLRDSLEFDEWHFREAERLRQSLSDALQALVAWHRDRGEYEPAIEYARRWLALDPLHEPTHRQLIWLHGASGRWGAALRQYEQCVHLFASELGVTPDSETEALVEAIRHRQVPTASARISPVNMLLSSTPLRSQGVLPLERIPMAPGPLIGRDAELADLDRLLGNPDVRLVTLLGPGGVGKTRLAIAYAHEVLRRRDQAFGPDNPFPEGVCFIPLGTLEEGRQLAKVLADALGLPLEAETGAPVRTAEQEVLDYLSHRRLLLILDDVEWTGEWVTFIGEILQAAPTVMLLVCTRERLHLREEHLLPLSGLPVPPTHGTAAECDGSPAVQLFVQRARQVRHTFAVTEGNREAVVTICRQVGGLPLAVELAATRVDLLTPAEIAAELDGSLDILTTTARNIPARQRSILATLDAAWLRLSSQAQRALIGLSIFEPDWNLDAARHVAGATLPVLSELADQALVAFDPAEQRYTLLPLARRYAVERREADPQLDEEIRDRHADYYLTWITRAGAAITGDGQRSTQGPAKSDAANVQFAWDWVVGRRRWGTIESALDHVARFWQREGRYQDGQYAMDRMVAALQQGTDTRNPVPSAMLRVRALAWRARFARLLGQQVQANLIIHQVREPLTDSSHTEAAARVVDDAGLPQFDPG